LLTERKDTNGATQNIVSMRTADLCCHSLAEEPHIAFCIEPKSIIGTYAWKCLEKEGTDDEKKSLVVKNRVLLWGK